MPLRPLRDYQTAAIARFADQPSAFFAMQMRLGKSLTCIRWLVDHAHEPQIIAIIAPKTVLTAWEIELQKEGHPYRMHTGGTLAARARALANPLPGFHLLNYEAVPKLAHALAQFDAIVCDESTRIKNPKAKVTKALLKLSRIVPIRACLSGLPNPEGWLDVFCQMAFCNGGSWMQKHNFWKWRESVARCYGYEYTVPPGKQALIRGCFQSDAYVLSRKQAGIRDEKIRKVMTGELSDEARAVYNTVRDTWKTPSESTKFPMVVATWLHQIAGGGLGTAPSWKEEAVANLLTGELRDEQVVVWFAYNNEISRVWKEIRDTGIKATWITGISTQEERAERINAFQSGKRRVMLIQQACGQYGIDLSAADTAIYYSSSYSHEKRAQSEERIFRVGKPNDLLYIDLVTIDTVDEIVQASIREKKNDSKFLLAKLNLRLKG